jgi:hypothetical protein
MSWFSKPKPDAAEALRQLPRLVLEIAVSEWTTYVSNSEFPTRVEPPPVTDIPVDRQDLYALFSECLALQLFFLELALTEPPAKYYRQQFIPALTQSLTMAMPFVYRTCEFMGMIFDARGRENKYFFEDVAKSHLARVFSLIAPEFRTQQLAQRFQTIYDHEFKLVRCNGLYQKAIKFFQLERSGQGLAQPKVDLKIHGRALK